MYQLATYTLTTKNEQRIVIIDLGDGFAEPATEQNLLDAIQKVNQRRRTYKTEVDFKYTLNIYQGALNVLRKQKEG